MEDSACGSAALEEALTPVPVLPALAEEAAEFCIQRREKVGEVSVKMPAKIVGTKKHSAL